MAGLWLVGEVVNLVGIYGSKVAEGFFRPLQLGLVPSMIVCNVSKEHEKIYTTNKNMEYLETLGIWLF